MIKRFLAWLNQPTYLGCPDPELHDRNNENPNVLLTALSAYQYLVYFDGQSYLIKIPAFPCLRLAASSFDAAVDLAEASIKSQLKKQIRAKPVGIIDSDECYVGVVYAHG